MYDYFHIKAEILYRKSKLQLVLLVGTGVGALYFWRYVGHRLAQTEERWRPLKTELLLQLPMRPFHPSPMSLPGSEASGASAPEVPDAGGVPENVGLVQATTTLAPECDAYSGGLSSLPFIRYLSHYLLGGAQTYRDSYYQGLSVRELVDQVYEVRDHASLQEALLLRTAHAFFSTTPNRIHILLHSAFHRHTMEDVPWNPRTEFRAMKVGDRIGRFVVEARTHEEIALRSKWLGFERRTWIRCKLHQPLVEEGYMNDCPMEMGLGTAIEGFCQAYSTYYDTTPPALVPPPLVAFHADPNARQDARLLYPPLALGGQAA